MRYGATSARSSVRVRPTQSPKNCASPNIEQRRAKGANDGTIRLELSKLRASLKWAEKKDLIGKAPFVWMPSPSDPRDVRLTREQAARYLAACEAPHLRLFVVLALTTGARKEALLDLTWDRVDFDARRINLKDPARPRTAKGKFIKMGLRRAGQRCGMEFVSAHVFRHSAATWMAEGGIPMAGIAQFLGHKDSRVTERVYARFSPNYLRGAASMLEL